MEAQLGEDVVLGAVHQLGEPRKAITELVGDPAPLVGSGGLIFLNKYGLQQGADHAALARADMGERIPEKMHDPNAIDTVRFTLAAPFDGVRPAQRRRRRDAKFP